MIDLRSYQQRAVDEIHRRESADSIRVCLQAPTGSGKTRIMAALLCDPKPQLVITHRRILLDQLSRVLTEHNIPHGFRASGHKPNPVAPIQLAMVQTEHSRSFKNGRTPLHKAHRVHVDEIHAIKAKTAREILDGYVNKVGADLIGYTASPTNLGGVVNEVIPVVGVQELIADGHLCQPLVFSCGQPDVQLLERLRRSESGEYVASDVNKIIKPRYIIGHVIEHLNLLSPDKRPFVLYGHSVKASIWWAQIMTARGIPTAHVDGDSLWVDGQFYDSDSAKRKECFARLEDGSLRGISNRFVLREGWDCPIVGHAILACPFGLRSSYVQACGRVLRPFPNRQFAIIQDHCGTALRLPMLDSDEPWDWAELPGRYERARIAGMRDDKIPEPIVCPKCMNTRNAGATCPYCGHRYKKYCRFVYQVDGQLKMIEGKTFRQRRITRRAGDDKLWARLFWGAKKNKPRRTFEQVYTYFAVTHGWRWLPRDLPLMPLHESGWYLPVGQIPMDQLIK
jgi:superfamily II DNA or RNA helicase